MITMTEEKRELEEFTQEEKSLKYEQKIFLAAFMMGMQAESLIESKGTDLLQSNHNQQGNGERYGLKRRPNMQKEKVFDEWEQDVVI